MMKLNLKTGFKSAPEPLEKKVVLNTPVFASVAEAVGAMGEEKPIHCLYPDILRRQAEFFLGTFPGKTLYAVKCNPQIEVLKLLYAYGVRDFEVASRAEIDLVLSNVGEAKLYYMNPVKPRTAIAYAYARGVRDFAFDCAEELAKILEETGNARDLGLHMRLSVANSDAALDLSSKFGIGGDQAVQLLKAAREKAATLGICFHVGSQCHAPGAFRKAIQTAKRVIIKAGVDIDVLDVGGGFPTPYPGFRTPPLERFITAIKRAIAECGFEGTQLVCEPGRAMVAEAGSVLVKVDLRKGDKLYLNDGTYGALFDAGTLGWRYPVRLARPHVARKPLNKFRFFGPTCDSLDTMPGPFLLPSDVQEGDWIEVQNLGGYGYAMRTNFNGFGSDLSVLIDGGYKGGKEFEITPVEI